MAVGAASIASIIFATAALAAVNFVTVSPGATLAAGSVVVSGTTFCTTGDSATATVILSEVTRRGTTTGEGTATFTCSGTYQGWSVVVAPLLGPGFVRGRGVVDIAEVSDNAVGGGFAATSRSVRISQ